MQEINITMSALLNALRTRPQPPESNLQRYLTHYRPTVISDYRLIVITFL